MNPSTTVTKQRHSQPPAVLLSETDILRNEYVYKLTNEQLAVRFWLMKGQRDGNLTTLSFIPKRLGESRALDDAVRCICSTPPLQLGDDSTTRSYLKALASLQTALNDSAESMTSGTLTAATLLYIHEIFANPFQRSWMVHADGVIKLLETRGPDSINTELDRSILCGQAGTIFLNSVQRRMRCFLAEPKWNYLLRQLSTSRPGIRDSLDDMPSLTCLSVYLPGLLCRYEALPAIAESFQVLELMEEISRLQLQLRKWRNTKDSRTSEPTYESEHASASTDPLNSAFRLSSVMFLILSNYMYMALLSRMCAATGDLGEDGLATLRPRATDLLAESSELADVARIRWEAVKNVDAVAAWACGTTNITMFSRVLSVSYTDSPELRSLRILVEDIHNRMIEDN